MGRLRNSLQIHNLLVPLDFSDASFRALELALPLAKRFSSDFHVVHVFEADESLAALATIPSIIPEIEVDHQHGRRLKELVREYGIELRRENIHYLRGRAYQEICRLAHDQKMDLIVIASRGNTGFKRLALGSTAERVVRYSPCPVLIVRGASHSRQAVSGSGRQRLRIKKILVPIDFSDCSLQALSYAKAFAREFGAALFLFHAVHPVYPVANDEFTRYDLPLLMRQLEKTAEKQIRSFARNSSCAGIPTKTFLKIGHPPREICEFAKRRGTDLIITSTHGRTGFRHVLVGSTAEYVVRHAECPVLIVPNPNRHTGGSMPT